MIDRNAQVGWSEAQWNRVRQAVAEEWQKVRVAGSVLPTSGPLPPSTEVVPSELVVDGGKIDDAATARIVELSADVELSGQQVSEDDLSDAVLLFRRAAVALARSEDQVIFNGQFAIGAGPSVDQGLIPKRIAPKLGRFPEVHRIGGEPALRKETLIPGLEEVLTRGVSEVQDNGAGALPAFAEINPGALGLVLCASAPFLHEQALTPHNLVTVIVRAIARLEEQGYGSPFVCFLGQNPFVKAHEPAGDSMILAADRIEPLLGRDLVRAPALDSPEAGEDKGRGLVVSLGADSIDIVVAVGATTQFTNVSNEGKYRFRVYERFALRVKDNNAIVLLDFAPPPREQLPNESKLLSARGTSEGDPATGDIQAEGRKLAGT